MKLLWLSQFVPYPPKGGSLQRSFYLLRECAKVHEVVLLTFNQESLIRSHSALTEATTALKQHVAEVHTIPLPVNKIPTAALSLLSGATYSTTWLRSRSFRKKLKQVINQFEPSVVHYDTLGLAQYLPVTADIPAALNHHNIESQMMRRRAEIEPNRLKSMYLATEARRLVKEEAVVCPKFAMNFTCSDLDSDRLRAVCPTAQVMEVPNGVDLDYFDLPRKPSSTPNLLFIGGLSWYPNLDAMTLFLKSLWPDIRKAIPGVSMTIIGRSPPSWMVDLAEKDDQLEVTGFVDDIHAYLARATAFVCPIRDGGGTKLKVLDCLASRVPLIADPIACEGISVEDKKNVLLAKSSEDYIRSINQLIEQPSLGVELGDNGRTLVTEKYSFSNIGSDLANFYDGLGKGQ